MEVQLIKIKDSIQKNLNEYIKWVIILSLYLFHRMMATSLETDKLDFIITPVILIGISVLLADRLIDPLILFSRKFKTTAVGIESNSVLNLLISISYLTGIMIMMAYMVTGLFLLINIGLFLLMGSGLLTQFGESRKQNKPLSIFAILVLLTGLAGCIHGFIFQKNGINSISFSFYGLFLIYYFTSNNYFKSKKV
jgi:hypothetical protein